MSGHESRYTDGVSVVIPAQNAEAYLAEAIESVVTQSPGPLEVIVVDDGSTDATAEVALSFGAPVRCVRQEERGVTAALNHGVGETAGRLLAFVDADDLWTPGKLALQLAVLEQRPEVDAVFGYAVNFGAGGPLGAAMPGYSRGTMLIRRAPFERVGAATGAIGEFLDWYARAVDAGVAFELLPDVLLRRRVHDSNMGVRFRDERIEYTRVLKTVLDRRRAGAT